TESSPPPGSPRSLRVRPPRRNFSSTMGCRPTTPSKDPSAGVTSPRSTATRWTVRTSRSSISTHHQRRSGSSSSASSPTTRGRSRPVSWASMRLSAVFAPTLRDDPAEAEIASHRLLLRAAFVRQVAAGVYTTLPLGLRSIRKIERIVREEMNGSGAQEFRMPIPVPAEAWKTTGRWELYGETLFRLQDRHERAMLVGPTQEEVVAEIGGSDIACAQ